MRPFKRNVGLFCRGLVCRGEEANLSMWFRSEDWWAHLFTFSLKTSENADLSCGSGPKIGGHTCLLSGQQPGP